MRDLTFLETNLTINLLIEYSDQTILMTFYINK